MTSAVPRWVRVVTVAAVSVVAAVAAVVSYVHMRELGIRAGEEWRADIIPLSADGLLVAASMVMLVRRRAGEKAGVLPWVGLVLGLSASLAANVAVADWTSMVSLAVSGWPPLALAVSFELLIMVTRDHRPARPGGVADTRGASGGAAADRSAPAETSAAPVSKPRARRSGSSRKRTPRAARPPVDLAALEEPARELVAGGAGRGQLADELAISPYQARQLLARIGDTNGDTNGAVLR
jgi:Protein of unknown function (DUF2637)